MISKKTNLPIAIDLFCGVGGMSLGFKEAGFKIAAAFDADPIHIETHSKNFPGCVSVQADITKLSGRKIRSIAGLKSNDEIDVLFGGPPCQGFSSMGHRRLDDERNQLLQHFVRIANELKPKYIVMENVEGLLYKNYSGVLDRFLMRLKSAGYDYRDIQVLNANDFGVPQRRKRAIVLAARRGLEIPKYPTVKESIRWSVWDAIHDLPKIEKFDYLFEDDVFRGTLVKKSAYQEMLKKQFKKSAAVHPKETLSGCMRTIHSKKTVTRFGRTRPGTKEKISRFFRLDKNGVAPTLRAGTGSSHGSYTAPRPIHPVRPRCITVREGARLHSFPDWFQFHPTKWHGFRQVGNSVPPLLAKAIAESVVATIK